MNKQKLDNLIATFFTCNRADLMDIFNEYLSVLEASDGHAPGGLMSRNYETAQVNPEIHVLPGNLKDARDAIFPYFWGTDEWFSKMHLENVKGPANYASLIGALACLLKNPNLCVDTYSQRSNELEVKAITSLANLVFYQTDSPWGVFTMGGTISNLYGGRIGIEKTSLSAMSKGLQGRRLAGIVSEAAHYSNKTVAGWLGIGTDNLFSVPTDRAFAMDLKELANLLESLYSDGMTVAFVIATFGSTDAFGVDDIKGMRAIIAEKAAKFNVPQPQLHVDAAVGWTLSFLAEYDVAKNPLEVDAEALPMIAKAKAATEGFRYADSVTIDFHKMGWGHYPSSAFIVNRRDDLRCLLRSKETMPYFCEAEYRRDPALFTLECSRPAIGPYALMASLNSIGLEGYQTLVLNALETTHYMKRKIDEMEYCKVLNMEAFGPAVVWWVLPKGRDAKDIFARIEAGKLPDEAYERYCAEVRHLFDRRSTTMNSFKDPRLSFTTSIGRNPYGRSLPAWKAILFNPRTDKAVVDQVIQSIEDL